MSKKGKRDKEKYYLILLIITLTFEILALLTGQVVFWVGFGLVFYCYYFFRADEASKIAEKKAEEERRREKIKIISENN